MVDLTGTSSTNLKVIERTLEDMDSLDMELFNESFQKSKSATNIVKGSQVQITGEMKKKVIFQDSNEDKFLNDLLSDEETSTKEKKSFSSGSKNNLIEDLFKIKTPVPSATSIKLSNEFESNLNFDQEDNQLFSQKQNSNCVSKGIFNTLKNGSMKEVNVLQLSSAAKNEEDIVTNVIVKSNGLDNTLKKPSLRETLFEKKPRSSIIMDSSIYKDIRKVEPDTMVPFSNSLKQSKSQTIGQSTREFRSGRRNIELVNDPLGLLSTSLLPEQNPETTMNENIPTKDLDIRSTKTEENLPEWLGGSIKMEDKKSEKKKEETGEISIFKQNTETAINDTTDLTISDPNKAKAESVHPNYLSMLFDQQFNQQTALVNMQQQEFELKTATVLSQQNEQLTKISNAQYTTLHNQEEQFNTLLKLQVERQALLEKQIKMQQERIDQYIQALMAQPISIPSNTSIYGSCMSETSCKDKEFTNERKEMEDIIKKLQMEKSKLKASLSTINERHNDEITFQSDFYQRQIAFVREALMKSEEQTRQEIECLETDYIAKLEKLKDEKQQIENQYKEEIHNLKNKHAEHVKELCDLHAENIKLLQTEYSNIIESISKAKEIEDQMTETMKNRKTDIEDMLHKANSIIETVLENKEKLEMKDNEIIEFREQTIKVLENNIKAQKYELKNQNNILEEHYNKFVETTEKCNSRLVQLVTELQKQNVLSNQLQEMLVKKSGDICHEQELFEEKVKWEKNYLQTLKESWKKEQENQLKLLVEEKELVATEKAQLEVLKKLKSSNDEIGNIELKAAIKTAQEATVCANREKLKWQEKINELNIQKQALQDKEKQLILRAKELENFTQLVLIKKNEGIKALKDAKHLEHQNKEKFNQLQMQFKALIEREKKAANEKFNVVKDRLISLPYEDEKLEKCRDALYYFQNEVLSFSDVQSQSQIASELMSIDPNLAMLTVDFNDEIDSINKYTQIFNG